MLAEILGGAALFATILGIFFSYNGKKTRELLRAMNETLKSTREILDRMDKKLDTIYDEVRRREGF